MLHTPDAILVTSALSLMGGRSRREWKLTLQTLKLIGVDLEALLVMVASDAWKWLGWDASRFREWQSALKIANSHRFDMERCGLRVVTDLDDDAPTWLRKLPAVPWVFYRGDLAIMDRKTIGFSGQRSAGEQSLAITSALGSEAVELGYTVVSGGARGIDMAAHTSALEAGGATAVILPQGLLTWRAPQGLAGSRVLAMSEDIPWDGWATESAMRRNRMIVDLSHIFTVPQSGTSGGSHSTGMYALRQGRVTYVPDLGPCFPGNHKLLSHGATPLVMRELGYDLEQMLADSRPEEYPSQTSLC